MNPIEKAYRKQYLKNFNPEEPSEEILVSISKVKTNGTSRLNPSTRNKKLTELGLKQLEFLAFKFNNSDARMKILSQLYFFIKLNENLEDMDMTIETLKEIFVDTFGFDYSKSEPIATGSANAVKPTEESIPEEW